MNDDSPGRGIARWLIDHIQQIGVVYLAAVIVSSVGFALKAREPEILVLAATLLVAGVNLAWSPLRHWHHAAGERRSRRSPPA